MFTKLCYLPPTGLSIQNKNNTSQNEGQVPGYSVGNIVKLINSLADSSTDSVSREKVSLKDDYNRRLFLATRFEKRWTIVIMDPLGLEVEALTSIFTAILKLKNIFKMNLTFSSQNTVAVKDYLAEALPKCDFVDYSKVFPSFPAYDPTRIQVWLTGSKFYTLNWDIENRRFIEINNEWSEYAKKMDSASSEIKKNFTKIENNFQGICDTLGKVIESRKKARTSYVTENSTQLLSLIEDLITEIKKNYAQLKKDTKGHSLQSLTRSMKIVLDMIKSIEEDPVLIEAYGKTLLKMKEVIDKLKAEVTNGSLLLPAEL